ncbi:MAG: DeoR/GlpR family DNA-binding transcription regulator [Nocardioides sp.]
MVEAEAGATPRRATRARHDALVALVRGGVDSVATLAERVGVSASTVRRDLTILQREGRIARTYGGAMVRESFQERSFNESSLIGRRAKAAIAAAAADLVPAGGSVFVDAGTTCLALARILAERAPLRVATRGLEAALLLTRVPDIDVVLVGGHVQPLSHGVVGPLASMVLDRLAFDVAFLGADAVDPDRGLGEPTVEETDVKERAAGSATEVVLLADASKIGPAKVGAWIPLDPAWTLVTDAAAGDEAVSAFERRGLRVLVTGAAD